MLPNEHQLADAKILYDYHSAAADGVLSEVVLVAGSHDLRVADHAAAIYRTTVQCVVCSGGGGKVTSGIWARPEGIVFADRIRTLGVPERVVLSETEARNTGDNVRFTRRVLQDHSILPSAITLVCKPYMARRALATAEKQWSGPSWHVSVPPITFEEYPTDETPLDRMINLMVGDTQRLRVYADQGFQVAVQVPDHVWHAYERLRDTGFDKFVIR